jgi:SAM-dependent methyltransferase
MDASDAPQTPWDAFQSWDVERWGETILDEDEQRRWSQAIFLGGLAYMWNKEGAAFVKEALWTKAGLGPGQRVLLIGEVLEACGFAPEIRARIEPGGELETVEIVEEARRAYMSGERGRGGRLATWPWRYTADHPDGCFDAIAVMQGTQHNDDWAEAAAEFQRLLVPGGSVVLAEISFGPRFEARAEADMHIAYLLEKVFSRMGWHYRDMPYYDEGELRAAFEPHFEDTGFFEWRGVEAFWGHKPR